MADLLAVSRTPVREALQRLEAEGPVYAQGRGVGSGACRRLSSARFYQTRSALGGLAAATLAQRQSDAWCSRRTWPVSQRPLPEQARGDRVGQGIRRQGRRDSKVSIASRRPGGEAIMRA